MRAVERAMADMRRGRAVVIAGGQGDAVLALAAEAVTPEGISVLNTTSQAPCSLVVTARRAAILGFSVFSSRAVTIRPARPLTVDTVVALADPLSRSAIPMSDLYADETPPHSCATAAVLLAKTARLLPAALTADIRDPAAGDLSQWAIRHGLLLVDAGDVFQYEFTTARSLRRVSEARVPLSGAEDVRIIAFRPLDGGLEHLALVLGDPQPPDPVLTRLHSECFTGDLLASLRCDCGDQLRGAIRAIARNGGGILLYLAQEGRGIGLVNKLRAYELQDRGFDTLEANEQLGFDADERVYAPAAEMLRQLGFSRVRLMTNNPAKVDGIARNGIAVTERVPHRFPANPHSEHYLRTKAVRSGHML